MKEDNFNDKESLMIPIEEPKNDADQTDNDLRRHKLIACTVGLVVILFSLA
jgi:hypothetical protein